MSRLRALIVDIRQAKDEISSIQIRQSVLRELYVEAFPSADKDAIDRAMKAEPKQFLGIPLVIDETVPISMPWLFTVSIDL